MKNKNINIYQNYQWVNGSTFCLSEPEAGSDATFANHIEVVDKGDHYIINGTKNWITNGGRSQIYVVIAQSNKSKGHKGINAFIVERNTPGFHIGPKENKLGIRGSDITLYNLIMSKFQKKIVLVRMDLDSNLQRKLYLVVELNLQHKL